MLHCHLWFSIVMLNYQMGMDQYLLIPFLEGWTSIYQLFWCSPGVQGFDTLPYGTISVFPFKHEFFVSEKFTGKPHPQGTLAPHWRGILACKTWLVGGWPTPLKNMTSESQLGWWHSLFVEKYIKKVPNHQLYENWTWNAWYVLKCGDRII
jgi:hypothetical protein